MAVIVQKFATKILLYFLVIRRVLLTSTYSLLRACRLAVINTCCQAFFAYKRIRHELCPFRTRVQDQSHFACVCQSTCTFTVTVSSHSCFVKLGTMVTFELQAAAESTSAPNPSPPQIHPAQGKRLETPLCFRKMATFRMRTQTRTSSKPCNQTRLALSMPTCLLLFLFKLTLLLGALRCQAQVNNTCV